MPARTLLILVLLAAPLWCEDTAPADDVTVLLRHLAELENDATTLRAERAQLEAELELRRSQGVDERAAELRARVEERATAVARVEAQLADGRRRFAELNPHVDRTGDAVLAEIEAQVAHLAAELADLQRRRDQAAVNGEDGRLAELSAALATRQDAQRQLNDRLALQRRLLEPPDQGKRRMPSISSGDYQLTHELLIARGYQDGRAEQTPEADVAPREADRHNHIARLLQHLHGLDEKDPHLREMEVANLRQSQETLELAGRIRAGKASGGEDGDDLRRQLHQAVERLFELRMNIHAHEIEKRQEEITELRRLLDHESELLEHRRAARAELIERRLHSLLHEDMSDW